MAGSRSVGLLSFCFLCFSHVLSGPVNIPLHSVSHELLQSALNALNQDSPTHHTYKGGNLISAQKLVESPYITYRLTLNLDPVCKEVESCPQEACTINLKQHEQGTISVLTDSIQCMYLYPQYVQDDASQMQETVQEADFQEQGHVENLDRQIVNNQSVELDHEVQATGDENERPFIAVRASTSGYCPGCPYELNPALPGLLAYGEQAVKSMDELIQNDFKHKLVRIIKVTRAVPPSSNIVQYQLLLEIGESGCLKNAVVEQSECSLQADIPTKICLVTFEQEPWHQNSRRITKNNCTVSQNVNESNMYTSPTLTSDSLVTARAVKEQHSQVETNEAYENLRDILLENFTHTEAPELEESEKPVTEPAFVKVVMNKTDGDQNSYGFTDKIKEFTEFLEDFDLPIKTEVKDDDPTKAAVEEEIISKTVLTDNTPSQKKNIALENEFDRFNGKKQETEVLYRRRRSYITNSDSDNSVINELAQMAVDILDDMDVDNHKRVILDIANFRKKETHDGFMYYLTLKVATTDCNEEARDLNDCVKKISEIPKICKIQMYNDKNKPVYNAKVLSSQCSRDSKKHFRSIRETEHLVGAATKRDVNETEIIELAQLGLNKFSENLESTNEPMIVEITEASSQVVSGMLYKIKVKLGTSDCPKGTKNSCQLKAGSEIKECLFSIWSRPWIDRGSPEITINCDLTNRKKRSLRGQNYTRKMLAQGEYMEQKRKFEKFMKDFDKTYSSDEEKEKRFKVFQKNLEIMDELQRNEQGTAVYGVTMFADIAPEEFRAKYLGLRPSLKLENQIPFPSAAIPDISLPTEFDWRPYNVVTPVKDQGACGSCWAFSVTGNVEGQYALKHGKLLSFSEQELVDCDKLDDGCEGGLPDNAYRAIENLGGLETEAEYPYEGEDEKCHFNRAEARAKVISAVNITSDETKMAQWLVKNGPISIGINANAMQFYVGGISHPFKFLCNPNNLDHGVLIVGYGVHKYPLFKKRIPFWTIKNSWGPRWGEQGYYRVYRGDGTCGLNRMASSAIVA